MVSSDPRRPSGGLVLVRLALGLGTLVQGWSAVRSGQPDGFEIERSVRATLDDLPGLAAWWGESVLLSNPDATAFLLSWSALLVGLSLLLGAFVRYLGWLAVLLYLHLWLYGPQVGSQLYLLAALAAIGCTLSRAGNWLGLDPLLDKQIRRRFGRGSSGRSFLD